MFNTPKINTDERPDGRYVSVMIHAADGHQTFVSVHFKDAENPDETNAAERARIVAKAKELLTQAASSC